jgi:periplasmic protein TonB
MLTRAFLMCSDPKALEAVSQVLAELEITFETFPDASLAAKRLGNQRFDPILVDCDNVQTATAVFESVRQSSANQSSMTIAIVDGKAGVPTAFRLGARLVMTKPVSLEQARSTLRNALAMQRREHESKASVTHVNSPASEHAQYNNLAQKPGEEILRGKSTISPLQPATQPPAQSSPALTSENIVGRTSGVKIGLVPAAPSTSNSLRSTEPASKVIPLKASRTERGLADQDSVEIDDATATQWEEKAPARRNAAAPSLASKGRRRKSGPYLVATVIILLVAAGCYAAFTTQPTFHDGVIAEYEDLRTLITGGAAKSQAVVASPRPGPAVAQSVAAQNPGASSAQPSNTTPATAITTTSPSNAVADGFAPAQAAPTQGFKGDATTPNPTAPVLLPTSTKTPKVSGDTSPLVVAEDVADAHVAYRVRAIYPYAARRKGVEGAVVLQASVNTDGSVDSVRIISGNPQLTPSAVEAVKQWRYEPYFAKGQPAVFQTQVTVRFQADSH